MECILYYFYWFKNYFFLTEPLFLVIDPSSLLCICLLLASCLPFTSLVLLNSTTSSSCWYLRTVIARYWLCEPWTLMIKILSVEVEVEVGCRVDKNKTEDRGRPSIHYYYSLATSQLKLLLTHTRESLSTSSSLYLYFGLSFAIEIFFWASIQCRWSRTGREKTKENAALDETGILFPDR